MIIKFLKATAQDIPMLQALAEKAWRAGYANLLSEDQIEYMLQEMYSEKVISAHMRNPHYHYFFLMEGHTAAGFIGFENHYERHCTKLHRIYLLPEYKGKGIGKQGIIFLKIQTEESGDDRIILNVNKKNSAKAMYESQGFQIIEELIVDICEGFVMDDYLMEYRFPPKTKN